MPAAIIVASAQATVRTDLAAELLMAEQAHDVALADVQRAREISPAAVADAFTDPEFGHEHGEMGSMPEPGHDEDEASLIFDLQTLGYDLKYFLPEASGWNTTFGLGGMQQNNQNRSEEFLIPEYRLSDIGVFSFTQKNKENQHLSGGQRYHRRAGE